MGMKSQNLKKILNIYFHIVQLQINLLENGHVDKYILGCIAYL